jgi:pyruvate kinase
MNDSTPHRRTKIVATLGPASNNPETLESLIKAGVNVFRLNFSHGSHQEHQLNIDKIREAASKLNSSVAILQDLCGPKIRITAVEGDTIQLEDGASVTLRPAASGSISTTNEIYVETLDPIRFLNVGEPVLLSDGIISLTATSKDSKGVTCKIVKGGKLRSKVGIAFPDSDVDLPATTEKDLIDLAFGVKNKVDYVAISFIRDVSDAHRIRDEIKRLGGDAHIIGKIERKDAIKNLKELCKVCHGMMVARGDLGLELPLEQVPRIQKQIIETCNHAGIPVIVATQMLSSMVTAIRPTRAEVSDVAAAVMQGADAVMLSEETAIGQNPVECVNYLNAIALEAEKTFEFEEYKLRLLGADSSTVSDAVAYASCAAANKVKASALIACTTSGSSVRLLAKYRPQQPLYGSSVFPATLRRMSLYWGVTPISVRNNSQNHLEELTSAINTIRELDCLPSKSRVVITGGIEVNKPGSTSVMEIREIE